MPHAVLIAVIFVAYFGLMLTIGCYIAAQGQYPDDHDDQDDQDAGYAAASLAA